MKGPTGLPVLLVFSVESMHSLQQLVLLAAARVVDKVPGQNLFELADGEVLYRRLVVQVRQRGPDPPLRRRTHLRFTRDTELGSASPPLRARYTVPRGRRYLDDVFAAIQIQE